MYITKNPNMAPRSKCNALALDDKWRKRMLGRAIKGLRWTDGTIRQDRLWAEFHWVLDGEVVDDPLKQRRAFSPGVPEFIDR